MGCRIREFAYTSKSKPAKEKGVLTVWDFERVNECGTNPPEKRVEYDILIKYGIFEDLPPDAVLVGSGHSIKKAIK